MAEQNAEFTTINNDIPMHYDNSVIASPDWVTIPEAAKMMELGDRQTRNKCKEFSWQKRYAKIDGRPVAYLLKSEITDYCRKRGPFITPETAHVVSENAEGSGASHTGNTLETPHATGLKVYKDVPEDLPAILASLENKFTPQITSFVETHKKIVDELVSVQTKNSHNERRVAVWKTSMFWLTGISIVLIGGLGGLWWTTSQQTTELSRANTDLSTSLSSTQKELYETKLQIMQKENELLTLKTTASDSKVQDGSQ